MGVLERGAGRLAVILEQDHVPQPVVFFEIEDPVPVCPEDLFDLLFRQRRQGLFVIGGFDDHLMNTDPVHAVVQAFARALQVAFHSQRWELVRHHSQRPAGRVRCAAVPVGEHFRGSPLFVTRAKWTYFDAANLGRGMMEVVRTPRPLDGDDHPTSRDGVFP
ncbi:MAG: hypothetical protein R2762_00690 [Bryobacteraceae bacterium]